MTYYVTIESIDPLLSNPTGPQAFIHHIQEVRTLGIAFNRVAELASLQDYDQFTLDPKNPMAPFSSSPAAQHTTPLLSTPYVGISIRGHDAKQFQNDLGVYMSGRPQNERSIGAQAQMTTHMKEWIMDAPTPNKQDPAFRLMVICRDSFWGCQDQAGEARAIKVWADREQRETIIAKRNAGLDQNI